MRYWRKRPRWLLAIDYLLATAVGFLVLVNGADIITESILISLMVTAFGGVAVFALLSGNWLLLFGGVVTSFLYSMGTYIGCDIGIGGSLGYLHANHELTGLAIFVPLARIPFCLTELWHPPQEKPIAPPENTHSARE